MKTKTQAERCCFFVFIKVLLGMLWSMEGYEIEEHIRVAMGVGRKRFLAETLQVEPGPGRLSMIAGSSCGRTGRCGRVYSLLQHDMQIASATHFLLIQILDTTVIERILEDEDGDLRSSRSASFPHTSS